MLEQEGEGFSEGFLEAGSHETVDYGVDRGVGVGHAVGPCLDFVRGVVGPVVWVERLEEDKYLDGTPADGEEEDDHYHHLGDFAPDADCSLRQEVDLRSSSSKSKLKNHVLFWISCFLFIFKSIFFFMSADVPC